MPSNERVREFQDLTSELRRRPYANTAELAELVNRYVKGGGFCPDSLLWDHTNASLACGTHALLNLLDEAVGVGRALQAREVDEVWRLAGTCKCGAPMRPGGSVCTSDPMPPKCEKCKHWLSHGTCPMCEPAAFTVATGKAP